MKTIALTSPFTTGAAVVQMQAALKRGNIFQADYLKGPQDGIAGEGTIRAFVRAKYWLGYSTASMEPYGGDQLYNYLTGRKALGPIMKIRRARRLKELREKSLGEKALEVAITQLGTTEAPRGSNNQKYGAWYGMNGVPWCAIFVSWALAQAGSKFRYAYCPFIVNDARIGFNGLQVVPYYEAKPGDLVLFNWDGDWDSDHIGFLEKKGPDATHFYSIEGNTAVGNDSNGGEVMRRYRHLSQVQAFVRVGA